MQQNGLPVFDDKKSSNKEKGYSLGGSTTEKPLSPSEVRRDRLTDLDSITAATSSPLPSPASSVKHVMEYDAEEDHNVDPELQAALAMSLKSHQVEIEQAPDVASESSLCNASEFSSSTEGTTPASNVSIASDGEPLDIPAFHSLMWDSMVTTDNDKRRWVGQSISTRDSSSMEVGCSTAARNSDGAGSSLLSVVGSDHAPWGLVQTHGGPCGVLAAVQAELLRLLLFGRTGSTLEYPIDLPCKESTGTNDKKPAAKESFDIPDQLVTKGFAMAIAIILARTVIMPSADVDFDRNHNDANNEPCVKIVLPSVSSHTLSWDDLEPWSSGQPALPVGSTKLRVYTLPNHATTSRNSSSSGGGGGGGSDNVANPKRQKTNYPQQQQQQPQEERIMQLAKIITIFLLQVGDDDDNHIPLDSFRRPGGVILLVMSLVYSRGRDIILSDMDDAAGTKLTSQFGHCSQELMNLLLTGQAVSNVFDNTLKPSGDLTCRGIQARSSVGYLSQLESLRYCEVGGYYKFPRFPVWVVGSTSHFTVLFGDTSCLKESKSDVLLEKCRRAFKAEEEGDENGYISTQSLGKVLESLNLNVGGENAVQTMAASLEVSGASIILWDDFWKTTSRMMMGASLKAVLQGGESKNSTSNNENNGDIGPPPLLITQQGELNNNDMDSKPAASTATAPALLSLQPELLTESDEELARRLAAEWGSPSAAARSASPMDVDTSSMSDEDYARKLQAQWDFETSGVVLPNAINLPQADDNHDDNDTVQAVSAPQDLDSCSSLVGADAPMQSEDAQKRKLDFEQFGDSFPLFHYNGLRGGTLTPFRVTRLSAEEAVGASIALSMHSSSSGGPPQSGSGGDLEDVVRTKWPSSMLDWLGNTPPYID